MRTGRTGKKTRKGPVRAAWGRWKAWRTTHRSHRLTARVLSALTVATLAYFVVLCYIAIAWTPQVVASSGDAHAPWSGTVDTEHELLIIEVELEGVPGDIRWERGPDGTPLPHFLPTTWPGVEWEVLRAGSEELVATGTIRGSRDGTDIASLPGPGEYVVSVEPVGDQGEEGYAVEVQDARLHPGTFEAMFLAFAAAWCTFGTVTILSVFYWNRKFPDEYRSTKYLALAYVAMSAGTGYLL